MVRIHVKTEVDMRITRFIHRRIDRCRLEVRRHACIEKDRP